VSDAGSGIAPDELPRVFDAFFRGTGPGRPAAGTGLGLAICRAFVEANSGAVEIHSAGAGRGTTVRFHLPVPAAEALAAEAIADE
jgi:two-component system sensor histidine kinase KdpD